VLPPNRYDDDYLWL